MERTQVGIALGDFITLCLIRGIGPLYFPGFRSVIHYDHGYFALEVIGYSTENLKIHTEVPSHPFLTLPSPSLSPPFPPFLYPLPLEVGPLKSS